MYRVDPAYKHVPKRAIPAPSLAIARTELKWYNLAREETPVPGEIEAMARAYLAEQAKLDLDDDLGFVILHRCGKDFYFLITSTWRNENELWETVFYKDGDKMGGFELFPREGTAKPAFCVWELAPVLFEKDAWIRFLLSARDEEAKARYLEERFAGMA